MRVATHSGSFHADEVFAVAVLTLLGEPLEVLRSRDPQVLADCDVRVDVGLSHDPDRGDFDHHQPGGAGERQNGIRYASFGLIWRQHGQRVGASAAVAARIDEQLVQVVDANDTGQKIFSSLVPGVRPITVDGLIAAFNPAWDSGAGAEEEDRLFGQALAAATGILGREIALAQAQERGASAVAEAVEQAVDPRLVVLERALPWREVVVRHAPAALFVAYPKGDGWGLQAIPRELGSFANRRDLPAQWAGLQGADLIAVTGVQDAVFCHTARFLAVAASRQGVLALAALALADGESPRAEALD